MRSIKFTTKDYASDNDDIQYAFQNNDLANELELIESIVAEVAGENDGNHWYWILKMKDGTFAWATGYCDYTGWDCQSGATLHKGFATSVDAWFSLKTHEYDSRPSDDIKRALLLQLTEELPFALFESKPNQQEQ